MFGWCHYSRPLNARVFDALKNADCGIHLLTQVRQLIDVMQGVIVLNVEDTVIGSWPRLDSNRQFRPRDGTWGAIKNMLPPAGCCTFGCCVAVKHLSATFEMYSCSFSLTVNRDWYVPAPGTCGGYRGAALMNASPVDVSLCRYVLVFLRRSF